MASKHQLLIIEDGDEYLRFFSRHLNHYEYLQARSLEECLALLGNLKRPPRAFVLDIRFDRIPREQLIGDVPTIAAQMFGGDSDLEAAWRYVIDNQGYLILRKLREAGHQQPALMINDLPARQRANLTRLYGAIGVVPSFDRGAIQEELNALLAAS